MLFTLLLENICRLRESQNKTVAWYLSPCLRAPPPTPDPANFAYSQLILHFLLDFGMVLHLPAASFFPLPSPESSHLPWVNERLLSFQESSIFSSKYLFLTLSTSQVSGVGSHLPASLPSWVYSDSPLLPSLAWRAEMLTFISVTTMLSTEPGTL